MATTLYRNVRLLCGSRKTYLNKEGIKLLRYCQELSESRAYTRESIEIYERSVRKSFPNGPWGFVQALATKYLVFYDKKPMKPATKTIVKKGKLADLPCFLWAVGKCRRTNCNRDHYCTPCRTGRKHLMDKCKDSRLKEEIEKRKMKKDD